MQENVRECTKVHNIHKHFLLQTIPDIQYVYGVFSGDFNLAIWQNL